MKEFCYKLIDLMNEHNVRPRQHMNFVYLDTQLTAAIIDYNDFDGIDNTFYEVKYDENDAVQCRKVYL